jgi:hypothetical protein
MRRSRLELQFAKQSGVPIVPVLMQPDYQASGWLGIVTAGALWVPLYDAATFDTGIEQLVQQIKNTVPQEDLIDAEAGAAAEQLFTVDELRGELERLRADLEVAGAKTTRARLAGEAGPCRLPAGVPSLPSGLRVSSEMRKLSSTLLSAMTGPRVGFHGMVRSHSTTAPRMPRCALPPTSAGRFAH